MQVGDERSLAEFERLFEGVAFHKGLEMAFTSTKAGGLAAKIGDNDVRLSSLQTSCRTLCAALALTAACGGKKMQVGEIQSKAFTKAFFGLYLGKDPVSADGKASMSQGIASILSEG